MSSYMPQVVDTVNLTAAEVLYLVAVLGMPKPTAIEEPIPPTAGIEQQQLMLIAGQEALARGPYADHTGGTNGVRPDIVQTMQVIADPDYSLWLMIDPPGGPVQKWYLHCRGELAVAHEPQEHGRHQFVLLSSAEDLLPFAEQLMGLRNQPPAEGGAMLVSGQAMFEASEQVRAGNREAAYGTLIMAGVAEHEAQSLLQIIVHARQTVGLILFTHPEQQHIATYQFSFVDTGESVWLFTPHADHTQVIIAPASATEIRAQMEQHVAQVQSTR